jgi:putative transposase
MSPFRKLSHSLWHCQYHIVWVPKYRHKILTGHIGNEVGNCIKMFSEQKEVEILEMSIQPSICCVREERIKNSGYVPHNEI